MRTIAIITARGGSKRIPHKNIKEFCGKPIIAYSIEAALKSSIFDEVMVSTDSPEIAEIAKAYGASVPFMRSGQNSNDFATTTDVLKEALQSYEELGRFYDLMCCIYPTAPFITAEKLIRAMHQLLNTQSDALIPVVQFSFPPQRGVTIENGKLKYQFPEYANARSQDIEPIYHDCGQFYFCNVEMFKKEQALITSNTIPFIISEEEVQDIDTPSDWTLAEMKYRAFINRDEVH